MFEPLVPEGEGVEVPHAIEEDDAVEMVVLVLDDSRQEPFEAAVERLAFGIEALETKGRVPRNEAAQVGDREATFPVEDQFVTLEGEERVANHQCVRAEILGTRPEHEDLPGDSDLRGRQPGAPSGPHGLDKIVDKPFERCGTEL